jgi:tetratricopeptide (TPR) repeat protein
MNNHGIGALRVRGYIDQLGEALNVAGWAWFEEAPQQRLEIEFLINGTPAGRVVAEVYRKDVAEAGIGDGHYGFDWPLVLPLLELHGAPNITLSAREVKTGQPLSNSLDFTPSELATRLAALPVTAELPRRLAALRAATHLTPEDPWPAKALADVLRDAGRTDEAAIVLRQLLAQHKRFWHAHVMLGHLARAAGERTAALSWFEQAAELAPGDVWRWLDISEELRALDRFEDAKTALQRAEEIKSDFWAVALGRGYCARAQAEHEAARRYFEDAIRLAPTELAPRIGLIEELRDAGMLDDARTAAKALLEAYPGSMPLLLSLAYTERQAGCAEEAARFFGAALAQEPENPTLLAELARQEYRLGRQQESNAHLIRALELSPGHTDAVTQLASQALTVGDAAQAYEIYRAAAAIKPDELAFRFGMLDTQAWQGRMQDALMGLQAMEREYGATPQLQSWRITLLRRTGQMDEALHAARTATAAAPQQFWLWVERFQTELLAGSDAMLQKSLLGIPATTRAERAVKRRCIGALAESLWQTEAALKHYEDAAQLYPNDVSLQEALARIQLMRFNLPGARAHLRRQYELMAADRRLRRESLNISQSLLGQIIHEYALDEDMAESWPALSGLSPFERVAPLATLVREAPDSTAAAAALLLALRQAEKLDFIPEPGDAMLIPRLITAFWDQPDVPADVEAMMQSWRTCNPGHEWRRFDTARAQDYLAAKFPGPVLGAFQRVREVPQKADIFRLAVLVAEGGVYADADDRCLRPLDNLVPHGANLVLPQEEFGCAGNHFLAAAPGHPVLQAALRTVAAAINRGDNEIPWLLSGPGLLTRVLAQHLTERGVNAGLPPGLVLLDRRELGRSVAGGCFATYKVFHMRHRKRIDAAALRQNA